MSPEFNFLMAFLRSRCCLVRDSPFHHRSDKLCRDLLPEPGLHRRLAEHSQLLLQSGGLLRQPASLPGHSGRQRHEHVRLQFGHTSLGLHQPLRCQPYSTAVCLLREVHLFHGRHHAGVLRPGDHIMDLPERTE